MDYLNSLIDVYIFVNIKSNDYVAYSDNSKKFDKLCVSLLNLNEDFNNKKNQKKSNQKQHKQSLKQ